MWYRINKLYIYLHVYSGRQPFKTMTSCLIDWLIDWLFNVKQYFSSYLWREQDPAGKWMALGGFGADNLDWHWGGSVAADNLDCNRGTLLNYLVFQYFDIERTWWRLFWVYPMKVILSVPDEGYSECTWWRLFQNRVVRTKFDIYVFITRYVNKVVCPPA